MLQLCYYVAKVFHISTLSVLSGLRATRTATTKSRQKTAAKNKHCEKMTSCRTQTCGLWISGPILWPKIL